MNQSIDLYHGGALDMMQETFAHAPTPWIDLSTGINPWPWPVPDSLLANAALHTALPTQSAFNACRTAMAQAFGVPETHILPVPGTAMAIALLPSVLPSKKVSILAPSYSDHARSWRTAGAAIEATPGPLRANAETIVLCNPNNPDGRQFSAKELLDARDQLSVGTLIVDEAYGELSPSLSVARHVPDGQLIVLRSFGKVYGLAGCRLGAVLGPPALLDALSQRMGDWPVSSFALAVGALAYTDTSFQNETRLKLAAASQRLDAILANAGLSVIGGTDLFRFVEARESEALWRHLGEAGIYVRRFSWSKKHLRIGLPSTPAAEQRLRAALMQWDRL